MMRLTNEQTIVHNHRIAYGIHGKGEPLVLIHGTPFFSHIWRNMVPKLNDAGYRVYVYDLLGFGHSERPQNPAVDTSVSAQLPVLLELLNFWQLDKPHIVAHDIGGAIAKQLGIFNPDRVKTLTLIDCVSFDSWPSRRTREQMQAGLEHLIKAGDQQHRTHFSEWLLSATYYQDRLKQGPLPEFMEMISGPVGQSSLFQHQIRHYDPIHTNKLTDRLHELSNLPVLIIWGADDQWQVQDWAHKLHEAIPKSSLNILENCGHLAMEDQPEKVFELVIHHLTQHSA